MKTFIRSLISVPFMLKQQQTHCASAEKIVYLPSSKCVYLLQVFGSNHVSSTIIPGEGGNTRTRVCQKHVCEFLMYGGNSKRHNYYLASSIHS